MLSFPFQVGFAYGCGQYVMSKNTHAMQLECLMENFHTKMTNQGIVVHLKFSNININFNFFIGFIVIYTQKLPYVINGRIIYLSKYFVFHITNLNNVNYTHVKYIDLF